MNRALSAIRSPIRARARLQHLLEALAVEQIKLRRACLETARGPGRAANMEGVGGGGLGQAGVGLGGAMSVAGLLRAASKRERTIHI